MLDDIDGDGDAGEDHDYHEEYARLEEATVPWLLGVLKSGRKIRSALSHPICMEDFTVREEVAVL